MAHQPTTLLFGTATPGVSRRKMAAFAKQLESDVAQNKSFCCLVTTDPELRRLNREFRKKDCPTDVLSFPAGGANGFLGEIAISYPRARAQAAEYGHTVGEEIEILM